MPDYGPPRLHETAGAVIVGARRPLIAFNVNLRGDVSVAREIAAVVREKGGGFPGVRALGLDLPRAKLVQVSMNVEDWEASALHEIVARIDAEAGRAAPRLSGPSSWASCPPAPPQQRPGRCSGSTGSMPGTCSSCARPCRGPRTRLGP